MSDEPVADPDHEDGEPRDSSEDSTDDDALTKVGPGERGGDAEDSSTPGEKPERDGEPTGDPDSDGPADDAEDVDPPESSPGSSAGEETNAGDSNETTGDADGADGDDSNGADDADDADEDSDGETTDGPEAATDGEGGTVTDLPDADDGEVAYPDPDEDIGGLSAPPDDEEMPLADHIEEMVLRLAMVLLIGAAFTAIGILWASEAIDFIWADVIPDSLEHRPHVYHPLELWMTRIKVAALLGILAALPMFVYQCYLFMRPGLYQNERKYYLAAVPSSVVLAAIGMVFSYLVILPILFSYFTFYSEGSADIAYALRETFDLVITLTGFLAVVFQIPLFIMLAIMMGVTTRRWLAQKRLYFWAAFAGLSFIFTMDPTGMAPIFVAITMIVLFEGTLLLLKWTGRG